MKITPKTLLIVGMAFALLISVLSLASRFYVLAGFSDIETENARIDGIRVLNAINDDRAALRSTVGDWAPWDDTYRFIEDLNDEYISANLTEGTLTNIRIDYMVFISNSGQILFSTAVNQATGKMENVPVGLGDEMLAIPDLTSPKDLVSGWSGILKTTAYPVLAASRPITKSDLSGPARGTLVMARVLDDKALHRINETTKLNTRMYNWDDPSLPKDCRAVQPMLSEAEPIYIKPSGKDLIATYMVLVDFSGNPVVMLKVSSDRKIYRTGLRTWWYYLVSMIAIGLFFTFLIMAALHRIVLAPLSRLNSTVRSIGSARKFYVRLPVQTEDELGQLAAQINKMLEELSIAGRKLSEQAYQTGLSEMASDMLHQVRNSLSPIAGNMDLMEKCLDQTSLARLDQALEELEIGASHPGRRDDLLRFSRMAVKKLEKILAEIQAYLNDAQAPLPQIENILQEYQLTAQIRPEVDPIDLNQLVEDALENIEPPGARTGQVIMEPGLSGLGPVLGNRLSLLTVVKTLLAAAAHFIDTAGSPKNKIHITANEISEKNKTVILLSITIMIEGFDAEVLDRVFERGFFIRENGSPGTSLHWCANIVNSLGGSLKVESEAQNQGLCFHLALPKADSISIFEEKNTHGK